MEKVIRPTIGFTLYYAIVTLLLLFFLQPVVAQETALESGDPVKGKSLFNANCASCHKLDKKMTGPLLRNIEARLEDEQGLGKDWLYSWIRNSSAMIKSGDPYANQIYAEYNQTAMTPFPQLSDQDIDDILAYTAAPPTIVKSPNPGPGEETTSSTADNISNQLVLGALVVLFALLVIMLFLVNKTLRRIAVANGVPETQTKEKSLPLWKAFVKNQFLVLVSVVFLLLSGAYFGYGYLMQIGVDQGYEPIQPIHYSHKIHAGDNKIECKYCHSSARVSKHAGIPSLNICMNCHKNISEYTGEEDLASGYTKEFYTNEIKKLYKAVGWDEENQVYTGKTKAVEWVRVHNLPDFVYFNHSQHVEVAGVECQKCHGPVEEMEVMYQYAPLTMGWCIDCHRKTDVNLKDNAYYAKIHEELSKKYGVEKLTIAQMGGIECGKCHY